MDILQSIKDTVQYIKDEIVIQNNLMVMISRKKGLYQSLYDPKYKIKPVKDHHGFPCIRTGFFHDKNSGRIFSFGYTDESLDDLDRIVGFADMVYKGKDPRFSQNSEIEACSGKYLFARIRLAQKISPKALEIICLSMHTYNFKHGFPNPAFDYDGFSADDFLKDEGWWL